MRRFLFMILAALISLSLLSAAPLRQVSAAAAARPNAGGEPDEPLVFWVDSFIDGADIAPGDGLCSTSQSGCSLRAALMEANAHPGPDTIYLGPGTFAVNLPGSGEDKAATGDLDITDPVFIRGDARGSTLLQCSTGEGCFDLKTSASITGVSLNSGIVISHPANPNSELDLSDCEISGGTITVTAARASILGCHFHNGNGLVASGGAWLALQNSTFDGQAGQSAVHVADSTAAIYNSTISGSTASNTAPASGIFVERSTARVVNSTISGNQAGMGAGILASGGTLEIASSTITQNKAAMASYGGGVEAINSAKVYLRNTILAGNSGSGAADCGMGSSGTITSRGYNLFGSTSGCAITPAAGDLLNIDPRLAAALKDNGGLTQTFAPRPGSPVVDQGSPTGCTDVDGKPLTIDQRGQPRPQDGNGDGTAHCDIGAVELIQTGLPGAWECWSLATPNACESMMMASDMVTPEDGWAVGYNGAMMRWNGSVWSPYGAPNQPDYLLDIDMVSASAGWAAGGYMNASKPALLRWDGTRWAEYPLSASEYPLSGISMVSANDGWAVGQTLLLHWNGSTWTQAANPTTVLNDVKMVATGEGYATLITNNSDQPAHIARWNGSAWSLVTLPFNADLPYLDATGAGQVWLAGSAQGGAPMIAHLSGGTWISDPLPTIPYGSLYLNGIKMVSATNGWAYGWYSGQRDSEPVLLHWNGSAWAITPLPAITVTGYGYGAMSASEGELWIFGLAPGGILHWRSGEWTVPAPGRLSNYMGNVQMAPGGDIWTSGISLQRWNGEDWSTIPSNMSGETGGIDFISKTDGWAAGGQQMLHWDGAQWSKKADLSTYVWAVDMVSSTDGWAGGDGFYHYNGSQWQPYNSASPIQNIHVIDMLSSTNGWAAGGEALLHWDGKTWSEVTVPKNEAGDWVTTVDMVSASDGWAATDSGYVLRWDGKAWKLFTTVDTGGMRYYYTIHMLSGSDGWMILAGDAIIGGPHAGRIFHWNGSAWKEMPRPTSSSLSSLDVVSKVGGWAVGWYSPILRYVEGANIPNAIYLPQLANPVYSTISGKVTSAGAGLAGVTVSVNDTPQVLTDAQGKYNITMPEGSYTVTLTKPGYTFTPTSRAVSIPPASTNQDFSSNCSNVLVNGGFEDSSGWYMPATAYTAGYATDVKHAGARAGRVGITNTQDVYSFSSMWQQVSVPYNATQAKFSFWLYPTSREYGATNFPPIVDSRTMDVLSKLNPQAMALYSDAQRVLVLDQNNNILQTLVEQRSNARSWKAYDFDLSTYAGRTIWLYFGVYNDGYNGGTGMYVDDASVLICK